MYHRNAKGHHGNSGAQNSLINTKDTRINFALNHIFVDIIAPTIEQ